MPLLSVIIPCYNAAGYIVRCLEALEHQVYKDFDIILIDDCSSDDTIKVIEEYKSSSTMSIQLLRNSVNSGPAASRKRGIINSSSEFICFCDCDDWYDEDFLLEMVNSQTENNSDVVICSFRLVFDSGKLADRLNTFSKEDLLDIRRILIKAPDSLCLMMVRRNILLSVPHPDIRNGEDMALVPLIVSRTGKVSAVNRCMYNYFCRGNSASMQPSMKMVESLESSFSFIENNMATTYKKEVEFIGIRNLLYGSLINLFKFSNNRAKANQIVNHFEITFPDWDNNTNIKELPFTKRAFLKCVKYRNWFMAKVISLIHSLLLK